MSKDLVVVKGNSISSSYTNIALVISQDKHCQDYMSKDLANSFCDTIIWFCFDKHCTGDHSVNTLHQDIVNSPLHNLKLE